MRDRNGHPDVVIVGGGIAGSALATVLARRDVQVADLERQRLCPAAASHTRR